MSGFTNMVTALGPNRGSPPTLVYDIGNPASYVGTGTMNNIGTAGTMSGTVSSATYVSTAPKYLTYSNSQVSFPSYNFGMTPTFSFWINANSGTSSCNTLIANTGAGNTANGFKIFWNTWATSDLYLVLESGNGSTGGSVRTETAVITPGTWQYLTVAWNVGNASISFYKNATLVRTAATGTPTNPSMNNSWALGTMTSAFWYMAGKMALTKVWDHILSQDDITADFNATRGRFGV